MKKCIILAILVEFSLAWNPSPYHRVRFVYDGDTVLLENGEQVRYLGIDTPEVDHTDGKSEFLALEAWKFNRKLVSGRQVRLEQDQESRDRYGRLLAYVFLKDGGMVNEILLQKGLAHVMVKSTDLKYWKQLLDAQQKAMAGKVGAWGRKSKDKEKMYPGNKCSYRFHRPDCPFGKKISKKDLKTFENRNDAFWEGFSPCRCCKP